MLHEWRRASQLELLTRGLGIFGLGFVPETPPTRCRRSLASGRGARGRRLAALGRAARADRRARLGRPGRRGRLDARSPSDARAGLRPAGGARGAPRPARGAGAVGDRARGQGRVLAARDGAAARAGEARAGPDRGRRHARPPGRARVVRAVQVRGRLRARRDRPPSTCLPRPGERPAEPRGGLPERRGRRRDRRRRPVRTARRGSPRPSAAPLRARSSICRSRS